MKYWKVVLHQELQFKAGEDLKVPQRQFGMATKQLFPPPLMPISTMDSMILTWRKFMILSLFKSLKQLKTRNNALALGASFSSLMALVAMGIHASVDFSLQIPANAATFMVLLALPWVVSVSKRQI